MAERNLPPVPYQSKMLDPNGMVTSLWGAWFRQVFFRVGGHDAQTNIELAGTSTTAQSANKVFSGPASGPSAVPGFRTLVSADIPAFSGDVTTAAGSTATTAASNQGNIATLSRAAGVATHGTNTNDSAASGYVGEYISGASTTLHSMPTSGQWADAANISLTAGDWDVTATFNFAVNGAVCPQVFGGISTTTGNSGTGILFGDNGMRQAGPTGSNDSSLAICNYRVSLSATTTYYAKVFGFYSAGTPQYTCRLSARRVR